QVTWASATPAVATISSTGQAAGVAPGTSVISATLAGVSGSTVLTVTSTTTPTPTPTPTPPPTITGEQVVLTFLKHNKKGKPIGKPVVSFEFQFSTAMNLGTTGNANNYQVAWTSTKKVKKKTVKVLHPLGVQSATYDSSRNSVTLVTAATGKTFAKGGQITILAAAPSGVSSAAG